MARTAIDSWGIATSIAATAVTVTLPAFEGVHEQAAA
jgi:hypothetical protein